MKIVITFYFSWECRIGKNWGTYWKYYLWQTQRKIFGVSIKHTLLEWPTKECFKQNRENGTYSFNGWLWNRWHNLLFINTCVPAQSKGHLPICQTLQHQLFFTGKTLILEAAAKTMLEMDDTEVVFIIALGETQKSYT